MDKQCHLPSLMDNQPITLAGDNLARRPAYLYSEDCRNHDYSLTSKGPNMKTSLLLGLGLRG